MEVYDKLKLIADEIGKIDGVVGVVLFGSYSRGDFDEGSDIDLLVIFKNKSSLEKGQEKIYGITAQSDLFIQAIALTLSELEESTILEEVIRDGKLLYAAGNLERFSPANFKPYALITYSATNLKAKEKVAFIQKLEGRRVGGYRYNGLLQKANGYKVGKGVLMIPLESFEKITRFLEENKVEYMVRYVWIFDAPSRKSKTNISHGFC
ncbi:nucleotidyltransferase domain-containing protein [Candidatus Bathyarchaeota archaeon]|nr:nucleotidyltransferase domain-containing protein [Candidatus Bathyarchaeota archaeon]